MCDPSVCICACVISDEECGELVCSKTGMVLGRLVNDNLPRSSGKLAQEQVESNKVLSERKLSARIEHIAWVLLEEREPGYPLVKHDQRLMLRLKDILGRAHHMGPFRRSPVLYVFAAIELAMEHLLYPQEYIEEVQRRTLRIRATDLLELDNELRTFSDPVVLHSHVAEAANYICRELQSNREPKYESHAGRWEAHLVLGHRGAFASCKRCAQLF